MATGIPVPAVIPEGSKAFTLCVPDDPFFYGVVMGLLKQATFKYFWDGTDEQKTAVTDRMLEMYYGYQDQVGCMDCANVAGCIEDDEATQAAIAAAILTSSVIQGALAQVYNALAVGGTMDAAARSRNLTGVNEGCDLNKLWGWIAGGIEGMNANNIDAQQSAELISNIFERASKVVSAIPGIGILPVDEAVDYVQGLFTDDLFEAYEANDTTGYRNELKCDIFCLAQANDCKVTIDLLRAYFLDRISYTGADVVDDIVEFLIDGVWTGTLVNDTFYLAQVLWMQNGNKYFSVEGLMSFSTLFALGEPNDDWVLLCEECPAEFEASTVGLFGQCDDGLIETVPFTPGEPFTLSAVNDSSAPDYWYLALLLPPGDWQVTLDAFTGTVTPPTNLAEDAYAWQGTDDNRHDVPWNTPATPEDFGTQDTRPGSFSAWCADQNWNVVLFNLATFTATFTVTAL